MVAVIAWTSRAAEATPLGTSRASGRNESITPAATVQTAKISASRNAPRPPGTGPSPAWAPGRPPGSQRRPASGVRPAMAATVTTAVAWWWPASQTPAGSATIAGTPETMPSRPRPSPRRSAGSSSAVSPPAATPQRPKPRPRTKLTASMIASGSRGSSASVGAPSSSAPAASAAR